MHDREHRVLASLREPKLWLLILIFFCIIAANSALTFWVRAPSATLGRRPSDGRVDHGGDLSHRRRRHDLNGAHSDRWGEVRYHAGLRPSRARGAWRSWDFSPIRARFCRPGAGGRDRRHDERHTGVLADAKPHPGRGRGRRRGRPNQLIANLAGFASPWLIGELKSATNSLSPGFFIIAAVEAAGVLLIVGSSMTGAKPPRR